MVKVKSLHYLSPSQIIILSLIRYILIFYSHLIEQTILDHLKNPLLTLRLSFLTICVGILYFQFWIIFLLTNLNSIRSMQLIPPTHLPNSIKNLTIIKLFIIFLVFSFHIV